MPRKQAANAAGHEIPARGEQQPGANSSYVLQHKCSQKKSGSLGEGDPFANSGRREWEGFGHRLCQRLGGFGLVLEGGRCDAKAERHLQSHDSAHDPDKRVVMHRMSNRIHDFTADRGRDTCEPLAE